MSILQDYVRYNDLYKLFLGMDRTFHVADISVG